MLSEKELNHLKEEYKEGSRVKLLYMSDKYAPLVGTLGTVRDIKQYQEY